MASSENHFHTSERSQEYKATSYDKHMRQVRYMRYVARCPGCGRVSVSPWNLVPVARKGK